MDMGAPHFFGSGEVAALADGEGILPPTLTRLCRARTTHPPLRGPPSLTREGLM